MKDSSLKPGTLCFIVCGNEDMNGRVVEVVGRYATPEGKVDEWYEVQADWLNNGTWGEPRRGLPRRLLRPIAPPDAAASWRTQKEVKLG